ncbi:MAG TPA: TIGR03617 family F420-dependent LLM class oxidoreductase [Acidimicrobiales bacterium]|nr:TIGR03617 family F420-dependent LLM class oxidoreductase [Acidimicrobiales bacterium]
MRVDGGVGGDLAGVGAAAAAAEAEGYDGIWAAETNQDPFLTLLLAAEHTERMELGTGIAVAFARNPMTLAQSAHDLQRFSQGRFLLGLGSQIKPHITRRFSMEWSRPAARMREMVLALRAIWATWNDGAELDFRGEMYTHTLMTPFFTPPPSPHGPPPVYLAAVGPKMTAVAGEVADGLLAHGFTTAEYLRDVTLPALEVGAAAAEVPRTREAVTISLPAFVVTGADDQATEAAATAVRGQIAFYGSTPAYQGVLDHHGWGDLHGDLNRLSKEKRWAEMGQLVDDDVLSAFAVVAEPDTVAEGLLARFGDVVDRLSFYAPYQAPPDLWTQVRSQLQAT